MALTADSPYMVENCKTLSVVAVVVDGLDLRGKIIGKHGIDPAFVAVLHSFLIVPAFEFQHIQSLFQLFHFFFHCGLAGFEHGLAVRISGRPFHHPLEELAAILLWRSIPLSCRRFWEE